MKRIISALLVCLLLVSGITACKSGESAENPVDDTLWEPPAHEPPSLTLSELIGRYNNELRSSVPGTHYRTDVEDAEYCSAARQLLEKTLKSPASAQYNSVSVVETDLYGRAIVYIDISALNGFGGYVRSQHYVFIQGITIADEIIYRSLAYTCKAETGTTAELTFDMFKSLNNFGEHPADSELGDLILHSDDFTLVDTLQPSDGIHREVYRLEQENLSYTVYIQGESRTADAIRVDMKVSALRSGTIDQTIGESFTEAFTGYDYWRTVEEVLTSVVDYEKYAPTDAPDLYQDCFAFNCRLNNDVLSYSIALTDKDAFDDGSYWSPLHDESASESPTPDSTTSTAHTTTLPPLIIPEPVTTQPPVTTTEPVTVKPPITTTEPVTVKPPVTTTEPVTAQPPVTTTEPVTVKPPVTTTEPVTVKPPVTTTEPVTTQPPVTTTEPMTTTPPTPVDPIIPEEKEPWLTLPVLGGVEIIGIGETVASGIYEIPSVIDGQSVVGIGYQAFYYDDTIRSITIPDSVTYISDQAFYHVSGLTSIIIPDSVEYIGANAFTECVRLADVYIESDHITVDYYAFSTAYQRSCDLTVHAPAASGLQTYAMFYWDADFEEWNG